MRVNREITNLTPLKKMKYHKSQTAKGIMGLVTASLITVAGISSASAEYISLYTSVYEGVEGGSGDVDNVLYQVNNTGTSVNGTLNTSAGNFIANFTSTTSLSTSGGQAHLTAESAGTYTNLTFKLLNDATFTKLQLNPDAIAGPNGSITFTVSYIMPAGVINDATFTLNSNGNNFFTVLANQGALMTSVRWDSTIGVTDANQYRVGGAAGPTQQRVPDGGTTIALLGVGLLGLGTTRKMFSAKA